jgi:hypothetical protein
VLCVSRTRARSLPVFVMVGKGKRKKKTVLVVRHRFKTATVTSTANQASATSGIWGRSQLQYFELDDSLKSILCVWLTLFNQVQVHFSKFWPRISVFFFLFNPLILPWKTVEVHIQNQTGITFKC